METNDQTQAGNRPVAKLRLGSVQANIWANPAQSRTYYTTTFERRYKHDGTGEWRSTQRYDEADLLALASLADKAAWKIRELQMAANTEAEFERKNAGPAGDAQ